MHYFFHSDITLSVHVNIFRYKSTFYITDTFFITRIKASRATDDIFSELEAYLASYTTQPYW